MCCDDDDENCCPCCSKQTQDRLFVVVVVALISFGYFSYWYLLVIPWQWYYSLIGWVNIVGLHFTFSLLCYSYYKAMFTSPGFVPKSWLHMARDDRTGHEDKYRDLLNFFRPRWCTYCQSYKPLRSHHSKDLNRMDHYCPWVYNAVGWKNHKYFFLFLVYASTSLVYFLVCVIVRVIYEVQNKQKGQTIFTAPELIVLFLQLVLVLPVTIAIISLLCYQISCIWSGMTSIESYTFKRFKKAHKQRSKGSLFWFYDFGFIGNFKQVLGPNIWWWWYPEIPPHAREGDGMTWKARHEMQEYEARVREEAEMHKREKKEAEMHMRENDVGASDNEEASLRSVNKKSSK